MRWRMNFRVRMRLGLLSMRLFKKGQYQTASEIFRDVLARKPGADLGCKARHWLGHSLHGMKKLEEAIAEFEKVVECKESGMQDAALFMIGNCYLRLGDNQSASEAYSKLLEEYPNSKYGSLALARTKALGSANSEQNRGE